MNGTQSSNDHAAFFTANSHNQVEIVKGTLFKKQILVHANFGFASDDSCECLSFFLLVDGSAVCLST